MKMVHLKMDTVYNTRDIKNITRNNSKDEVYSYSVMFRTMTLLCTEKETPWSGWSWLTRQFGAE